MASWGFWEWLTYGCIAISAIMLSVYQGVQRSGNASKFPGSVVQSPLWAYTPFSLMLLSAVLILLNLLFAAVPGPNLSKVAAAPVPEIKSQVATASVPTPLTEPSELDEQTNQDIREYTYAVNQRLHDFTYQYFSDMIHLTGSADQIAAAKLVLDEKLNRDFRQQYEAKITRLDVELARRLKIDNSRYKSFPPGRIDASTIEVAGYYLITLANKLP